MLTNRKAISVLKSYIKDNGKAKTAVALGLKETNAINNWLARKSVPDIYKDKIELIDGFHVYIAPLNPERKL